MTFVAAKALAFILSITPLAQFQIGGAGGPQNPVRWEAGVEPNVAHRGEAVTVRMTATIDDEWYLYSHTLTAKGPMPTEFSFDLPEGLQTIGGIEAPEPETKMDEGFGVEVEIYHGTVTFEQKVLVGEDAPTTSLYMGASVRFQTCSGTRCLPPRTEEFELALVVEEGAVRPEYAPPEIPAEPAPTETDAQTPEGAGSDIERARESGLLAFLLFAIVQGLLALLTPCVYPMIPITISFFLKQGEQQGRKPVLLATTYSAAIIATFTAVGMLLAAFIGPTGASRLGSHPIANLFLAVLFIAFALNLFGMFEIRVPARLQNYLSGRGSTGGYGGTVFMGLAFTLASLTCTAPFIGALLGLAATGEWFWPLIGMLGFSFAFSLPFFFLALFPQYLASMPKSGGWMNAVKVVMGFLVLAVSLKFLSNVDIVWDWDVFTRRVILAAWAMISVFIGLYLLGKIRLPNDSPVESLGVLRMLLSLIFLTFGLYLATGLFGMRIAGGLESFLPAPETQFAMMGGAQGPTGPRLDWNEDLDAALAEAKAEQKPVFIDFTGETCTNCKWMERNIFPLPEVTETFQEFALAKLSTDSGPDWRANQEMQVERFGTAVLPLYVVLSPDNQEVARLEGMTRDPDDFVAFLEKGLSRANASGG